MLEEKAFFTFCDAHFHLVQSGLLMDIKSEFSSAGDNAVFYGCTCAHEREEYESQKKLTAEFSKELKNLHFFPLTIYNLIFILSPYIIIRYNVYAIMT